MASNPHDRLEPGSIVDAEARERHTDLLFSAEVGDARMCLYVLVEHQSTVDRGMLIRVIAEWAAALSQVLEGGGREALEVVFVYLSLVEGGSELYDGLLEADVTDAVREVAMGLRKGWEDKARLEGEARGRAELLVKQLQLKFGELPEAAIRRVRAASADELDRWGERVLTAESLDDLWS